MIPDVVAIDGPAASGKSTVARQVAAAVGSPYVDSGALYRGVTWLALENDTDPHDEAAVVALVDGAEITFFELDGAVRFRVDGRMLDSELRTEEVNGSVSVVAALPAVRTRVVGWLRGLTRFGKLVMEGRDIGTAVFPDAPHKFYLDASPEERARRRHAEMSNESDGPAEDLVRASLQRRDKVDSSREMDPLKVADGATRIDSTGMGIEDVVAVILDRVGRSETP